MSSCVQVRLGYIYFYEGGFEAYFAWAVNNKTSAADISYSKSGINE